MIDPTGNWPSWGQVFAAVATVAVAAVFVAAVVASAGAVGVAAGVAAASIGATGTNFDFMCRELRFSALDCLKYYPSDEVVEIINRYSENNDADVRQCAKDSLAYMLRDRSR